MNWRVVLLVTGAAAVLIVGLVLVLRASVPEYESPGGKPIGEQSCRELERTVNELGDGVKLEAYRGGISRRIHELGGCPNLAGTSLD